jgi:hypothetical protein
MPPELTPEHFAWLAALAGACAALALWRFLVRLRRDRLLGDTPTARIRSAPQGYVKLSGRALPAGRAATAAPLSERPCVWWAYELAHEETNDRGKTEWDTVERGASVEPFVLADDDGAQCLVGPVTAEITPTASNVWYGNSMRPSGPPPASNPLLRSGPWRYSERLIGVGVRLSVMGELRSHSELGDANAAAAAKLHEWKQNQAALLKRFDTNHDGKLDESEWEAARQAAARESQTETLAASIQRISVVTEPTNGEPFLIAPLSGEQLKRRERRYATLYFVLGLIGVLVCAWAISQASN